jgi:hypothetical protein
VSEQHLRHDPSFDFMAGLRDYGPMLAIMSCIDFFNKVSAATTNPGLLEELLT